MSSQSFFSFDKTKAEIKCVDYNQKAFKDVVTYSLLPLFSKTKRPDIYLGDKALSANNYHNKEMTVGNDKETAESSPNGKGEAEMLEHSAYDDLKKERRRYFTKENITIKCYNCGAVGHFSKNCPYDRKVKCIRCNEIGHEEHSCTQVKCFKCNQMGHRAYECKASKANIIQCKRCNNFGHISSDCLIDPKPVNFNNKFIQKLRCAFCNSRKHFLCPFKEGEYQVEEYNSDEVDISEDNEEEVDEEDSLVLADKGTDKYLRRKRGTKPVFEDIPNEFIQETIFCYKCGEMHSSEDCSEKIRENTFDLRRQQYSFQKKTNYHQSPAYHKNPPLKTSNRTKHFSKDSDPRPNRNHSHRSFKEKPSKSKNSRRD